MDGKTNADLEAILGMTILHSNGQNREFEAVIDTGFNGSLTLPPDWIRALGLQYHTKNVAQLADGRFIVCEVYKATILWMGQDTEIYLESAESTPLLGTELLANHELRVQLVDGGEVAILPLPVV